MRKLSKSKSLIAFIMTIVFIFTNFSTAFAQVESKKNSINSSMVSENPQINIKEVISNTAQYMINEDKDLSYGREWCIMGLSRAGIKLFDEYYENYYKSVVEEINDEDGDFSKVTDLERIILALNSIGKDPTSVGDHNLIDKLWNYENITKQGLTGPVFALLALDSKKYEEPKNAVNTRESLIKSILEFKTEDGGFSLFKNCKNADVDMTAMALQALSNYMDNEEVKEVVESSLKVLSENQLDNGGYKSEWSGENVQSSAQVIVALTALGKDILDSSNGFVKKDGNLLSYVMIYQNKNGGFEYPKGTINSMATEQAMYGLVSYDRFADEKNKLYDMSYEETSGINENVDLKIQYLYTSAFLENKINKAKDYNKENYTEASFNLLESAISKGEETKDNIESKQENLSDEENKDLIKTAEENIKDIDNAENNLEENKDDFKKQCSEKAQSLKEKITEAENYKEGDYTEDSFKALTEAITKGKEIVIKLENDAIENSSEEELQSLINDSEKIKEDIESAIRNLEKNKESNSEEDKKDELKKQCSKKLEDFKEIIKKAESYKEEDYTEDSFKALTEAITNGEEIVSKLENDVIENSNEEELQSLINDSEKIKENIESAISKLEKNKESDLEEDKKDELKKQCSEKLEDFKEIIKKAESYKEEDYTEDSFKALTEAITNGEEIVSKLENDVIENSNEEELQSLINDSEKIKEDIESAISKLEKNKESNLEEDKKDELKKQCLEKLTEFKGKITEVENYSKEDYTEDSFEALTKVITNSKKIIENIKEDEIENLSEKELQDLIEKLGASIVSIDNAIKSLEKKSEEAKITFSVEIRTIGKPDIIPPTEVNIKEGETVSDVLNRILNEKISKGENIKLDYSDDGLLRIRFPKSGIRGYIEQNRRGPYSGWMYNVNGIRSNAKFEKNMLILDDGLKEKTVKNGDVVRVYYTCRGCGQDVDCLDNMEKLKETISKTEEYHEEDYTKRSFDALVKAVESSKPDILSDEKIEKMMVEGGKKDLSPEIEEDKELTELEKKFDDHIEEIENAIKDLVKVNMADNELKDQCIKYLQTLKDKIEKGETYKEKDYTEDSFNLLKDAIKNIKETISDTDEEKIKGLSNEDLENLLKTFESNLDNIDKAISNLKETNTELKTQCLKNSELLNEKIEEGRQCNKEDYTEDSFKALQDAISNGEKTLGDLEEGKIEDLNKEQLQSLIKTAEENIECIENAIKTLKETSIELKNQCLEEAKLLKQEIEKGKKYNKENYTEDSFKALEDVIANGEKTISNISDDVLKNLSTDELKSLIKTVGENKDNIDAVINNLKETSIELRNQCLEKAKLLDEKIEEGKKYNKEDYTENSFKSLKDAIENAKVTSRNISEDKLKNLETKELQSLIDKIQPSIDSIENAIKALEVQTKVEKVTFSIERRVLGQPDIMPPTQVNIKPGELTSVVLDRILKEKNINYKKTGEIRDAFYLATMNVEGKWLGEFDHGYLSGWMYSINGSRPNVGMAGRTLKDGDVVRIYYTCKAFGQDIDCVDTLFNLRDKVKEAKKYKEEDYTSESFNVLKEAIKSAEADIPSDEELGRMMSTTLAKKYNSKSNLITKSIITIANAIAKGGDSGTWVPELDEQLAKLSNKFEKHIEEINKAIKLLVLNEKPVIPNVNVDEAIESASKWILKTCPNPTYSNEWYILGLARGGYSVPSGYYEKYYEGVKKEVQKQKGTFRKVTDLERIILALTSIGKDPTNVGGYNLIDILFNYKNVNKQGLNGPVFALIALDTNKYSEPANAVNTRDSLIKEIMKYKTKDGGFSLFENAKNADVDMTAMTVQALSNYTNRSDVKAAVDSSLKILSKIQLENGGYKSDWSGENVQSPAQVIVALTALGKDIMDKENGFVKENGDLLSSVMEYKNSNGAFEHPKNVPNGMATEQSLYTLVSYKRFCEGKNKLYDMTDVVWDNENKEAILNKLKELKDCLKEAKEYKDVDYTEESHNKLKTVIKKIEKYIETNEKDIEKETNKDNLKKYFKTIEDYLNELDNAVKNLKTRPSEILEIKNNENNIKVNFNKGILPENSVVNVKNIIKDDEAKYTSAKQTLNKFNSTSNLISLYDIKIEADGKTIEPKDYVSVSITLPGDYVIKDNKTIKVVKLLDDGSVKEFDCKLDGKNVIFKTKEFSLYSIIEVDKEDKPSTENKTDNSTDDESNDEVSDNDNSSREANVSYSSNDSRGSSSNKSGLKSRHRGTSSSSDDGEEDADEDEDEDEDSDEEETIEYDENDKEMIKALKENNGDLRDTINEFKNIYSSNMNKTIGGLVALILVSNIAVVLFMKKKK